MIDLKLIFNTSYASLTSAVSGRGIGGVAGAFLGGIVADKFEKRLDVCTGIFCVISAAILAYIPLAPTMDYLWFLYFGLGLATCVLNICKYNSLTSYMSFFIKKKHGGKRRKSC